MPAGLFGITNDALNLVVNLLILFLVVLWLALVAWTYLDARRRIEDPVLVACATAASLFPFLGTIVYSILRPPGVPRRSATSASSRCGPPNCESGSSRRPRARTASIRSSAASCAARTAEPGSRTLASRAASRSTPAGRSARTVRRRPVGPRLSAGRRRNAAPRRPPRRRPAEALALGGGPERGAGRARARGRGGEALARGASGPLRAASLPAGALGAADRTVTIRRSQPAGRPLRALKDRRAPSKPPATPSAEPQRRVAAGPRPVGDPLGRRGVPSWRALILIKPRKRLSKRRLPPVRCSPASSARGCGSPS